MKLQVMLRVCLVAVWATLSSGLYAQTKPKTALPLSQQMADSFMQLYPDSMPASRNRAARWGYEHRQRRRPRRRPVPRRVV